MHIRQLGEGEGESEAGVFGIEAEHHVPHLAARPQMLRSDVDVAVGEDLVDLRKNSAAFR